jgi:hypothetical protein
MAMGGPNSTIRSLFLYNGRAATRTIFTHHHAASSPAQPPCPEPFVPTISPFSVANWPRRKVESTRATVTSSIPRRFTATSKIGDYRAVLDSAPQTFSVCLEAKGRDLPNQLLDARG